MAGELPPGTQLPTEPELMVTYDVSRHTVREALALLRADGLVAPRQGAGTYVRELHPLTTVQLRAEIQVTARMPTPDERARWELDEGVPVLVVGSGDQVDVYPADRTRLIL
jgi:GntR family transcriptional regulator